MSAILRLSEADMKAALAYGRWLHMAEFTKARNAANKQFGIPPDSIPVCLNTHGKKIYETVARELNEHRRLKGMGMLLGDSARMAVVKRICELHYGEK